MTGNTHKTGTSGGLPDGTQKGTAAKSSRPGPDQKKSGETPSTRTEKIYVRVNSDFDTMGYIHPLSIQWDDGRIFYIDEVRESHASDKGVAGSRSTCYIVIICGQVKHLFFERFAPNAGNNVGRWFVERSIAYSAG